MSAKRKPWFPMDYGYTEDVEIVEALLTYGHKSFVLWCVLVDVLYQRGGTLAIKPYVILELEDRAKLSNHEVITLLGNLAKVGLINYDKSNEKITVDRVTKELNLRANFSEKGRKYAQKRWKSGQDPKSDGSPDGDLKATQEGTQKSEKGMGTHMPYKDSKDSNVLTGLVNEERTGGSAVGPPASVGLGVNFKAAPSSFDAFEEEYPGSIGTDGNGNAWREWCKLYPEERQAAFELLDKFAEQFEVCTADEYLIEKYWLNVK